MGQSQEKLAKKTQGKVIGIAFGRVILRLFLGQIRVAKGRKFCIGYIRPTIFSRRTMRSRLKNVKLDF